MNAGQLSGSGGLPGKLGSRLAAALHPFPRTAAAAAAVVGCLVLCGWVLGSTLLIGVLPGLVPMNPATAIAFVLGGTSLWLLTEQGPSAGAGRQRWAGALAAAAAAVGVLRLAAYLPGCDVGIDQLLFREKLAAVAYGPNRMAPGTASAFLLLGVALLLQSGGGGRSRVRAGASLTCALATAGFALFAVTGYAYATFSFTSSTSPTPMALHTAATFLLLSVGVLMAGPWRADATAGRQSDGPGALGTKVAAGFSAALLMLAAVGMVSYRSTSEAIDDSRRVAHTLVVLEHLKSLYSQVQEVETGARGYALSGDEAYLAPCRDAAARLHTSADELSKLTADNPAQQQRLAAVTPLIRRRVSLADQIIAVRTAGGLDAAAAAVREGEGRRVMDQIRQAVDEMTAAENRLLAERDGRARVRGRQTLLTVVAGSALGFVCVGLASLMIRSDMARRHAAEQRVAALNRTLELQNAQLEGANKELEAFSYSVSHDLRAPLRSIDGFSQALLEDYAERLDGDGRGHLQRVCAATQRMGQLIDDMLNLSRVTRVEMRRERVDLSTMARAVAADLRQAQPDRSVELAVADGLAVEADARLMRVVLENLLGNAWKFTSKRADARVELGSSGSNGSTVFFVRDNGAGFDMAYAGKLFGAFQRLHGMTEFAGTGVGLATVQRIVRRHGGRVWAEGEVGRGATVYFTA